MDSFLIKLVADEVVIYENDNGDFIALKHRGEEVQAYEKENFWSWWEQKVEYDERAVSFVVITDREEFVIPENIATDNDNAFLKIAHIESRLSDLARGHRLLFFPEIESFKTRPKMVKKKEQLVKENVLENKENLVKESILINKESLASYFRRRTDEYQDKN
jgi:hypothetical protein